ncbi:hypothetical protein F4804DRAFT_350150 [Jackrogersella minutella]|nr:hypothetical protein F4804DRAFT_350150 [Jackrogersella minutella]
MENPDIFGTLPLELQVDTLKLLSPESLIAAIHASPALCNAFNSKGSQHLICHYIITRDMEKSIFPVASALYHAKLTTWTTDNSMKLEDKSGAEYTQKVVDFCDKHLKGHDPAAFDLGNIDLKMMLAFTKFHNVVPDIAELIAVEAGKHIPKARRPSEWARLIKCVYMYELARVIVPYLVVQNSNVDLTAWCKFWGCFAPWEAAGLELLEKVVPRLAWTKDGEPSGYRSCTEFWVNWGVRGLYDRLHGNTLATAAHSNVEDLREYPSCSLFDRVCSSRSTWNSSVGHSDNSLRRVLEIVRRFPGEHHAGPRDVYLWSELYKRVRMHSPLKGMERGWGGIFWPMEHTNINVQFCHCPRLKRFSIQDRRNLDSMFPGRYPTFDAMIQEAEAIAKGEH